MAATAVASMAGVLGAIVHDFQQLRLQRGESLADDGVEIGHVQAGRVLRKGCTVMPAKTPPVT